LAGVAGEVIAEPPLPGKFENDGHEHIASFFNTAKAAESSGEQRVTVWRKRQKQGELFRYIRRERPVFSGGMNLPLDFEDFGMPTHFAADAFEFQFCLLNISQSQPALRSVQMPPVLWSKLINDRGHSSGIKRQRLQFTKLFAPGNSWELPHQSRGKNRLNLGKKKSLPGVFPGRQFLTSSGLLAGAPAPGRLTKIDKSF
jgi:hypothetical protein